MRYGAKTVIVVSYADFITLLFAFFVVLLFVFPGGQAQDLQHQVPLSNSEPMPFANVQAVENVERCGNMERFVAPTKGKPRPSTSYCRTAIVGCTGGRCVGGGAAPLAGRSGDHRVSRNVGGRLRTCFECWRGRLRHAAVRDGGTGGRAYLRCCGGRAGRYRMYSCTKIWKLTECP